MLFSIRSTFLLLIVLSVWANTSNAQLYYPPSTGSAWETLQVSNLGWCQEHIDSLLAYAEANNTKALLIFKDGKIVVEKYFGTFQQDSQWYWASAAKSLTSCLIGIAEDKGLLSIDSPTSKYLGQGWSSCDQLSESIITVRNQLTMTTGFDDAVVDDDCTVDSCLLCLAPASTRWAYHNAPYTLLENVIETSSGMSMNAFLQQELKSKIGMTGLYLKQGFNNVYYSTARSMARFALLNLSNGIWNSDTIFKNRGYVFDMKNSSQNINLSYGYLWWLNGKASYMLPDLQFVFNGSLMPNAPSNMYSALGKNGQIINIVPDQNIILIRLGNNPSAQAALPMIFNNNMWQHLSRATSCTSSSTSNAKRFLTHPNPSSGKISIADFELFERYEVIALDGKILSSGEMASVLDFSDLENGTYIIRLYANQRIAYTKFQIVD